MVKEKKHATFNEKLKSGAFHAKTNKFLRNYFSKKRMLRKTQNFFSNLGVECLCFFYFDPLQNHAIVMSRFMHFIFCRGREV